MTDHDIIDRIDELVDDQLSRYPQRTGYDHNAAVQMCPHCDDEWHGLPITEQMREMRAHYCGCHICDDELDQYRADQDDSPVWCPGSQFVGPWATPTQLERIRKGWTVAVNRSKLAEWARAYEGRPYVWDRGGALSGGNTDMPRGVMQHPEWGFTPEQRQAINNAMVAADAAQWWTCDSPEGLQMSVTRDLRADEDPYLLEPPTSAPAVCGVTITVNGEHVRCSQAPDGDIYIVRTRPDRSGLASISLYAENPPTAGTWRTGR